jgi:hypothetical protein
MAGIIAQHVARDAAAPKDENECAKILTYAAIDEKLGHGSWHAGASDQRCVAQG